jgi:uncharacterized protein YpmS
MKNNQMTSKKWKFAFFALAAFNILTVLTVVILIQLPAKDDEIPENIAIKEDVQFQVNANKEDLNQLIAQYLEKEGLTGPIDYKVYLTDVVELYGTLPVFGREVEFKLTFEPEAQSNGDLVLKQESISLGQMNLPVSYVMKFINNQYSTPDWVSIRPNEQLIYVSLQNMELKSNIQIRAKEFDLKNDNIAFILTVPSSLQP